MLKRRSVKFQYRLFDFSSKAVKKAIAKLYNKPDWQTEYYLTIDKAQRRELVTLSRQGFFKMLNY